VLRALFRERVLATAARQPVGTGQRPDPPEHCAGQAPGQVVLGQQEPVVARVRDQPPTRLDEALLETGQRPRIDTAWRSGSRRSR
jgi:hypothetical protein